MLNILLLVVGASLTGSAVVRGRASGRWRLGPLVGGTLLFITALVAIVMGVSVIELQALLQGG